MQTNEALNSAAQRYIDFLNKVGQGVSSFNVQKETPKLFAEKCAFMVMIDKKITSVSRDGFEHYLNCKQYNECRRWNNEGQGWNIKPIMPLHPCPTESSVTITCIAKMKYYTLFVTSILRINEDGLIEQMIETENLVEDLDKVMRKLKVKLTPEEIIQKAQNSRSLTTCSKPQYHELDEMARKADIEEIKYIVLGVIEADSRSKIESVINTLLNRIEYTEKQATREKNIEKLIIALTLIPEEKNPYLVERAKGCAENVELHSLEGLQLDLMLKWKDFLSLSSDFVSKVEILLARRNELLKKDLPRFVYN